MKRIKNPIYFFISLAHHALIVRSSNQPIGRYTVLPLGLLY
jgi:hypothetical protein